MSESAIDSRVKSARRALGDDGKAQRFIRTVHGRGYRFVADATESSGLQVLGGSEAATLATLDGVAKPSVAVIPFRAVVPAGPDSATIADALADELIAELSRLRWLFVIARGSSFRFRSAEPDLAEVGKVLGVRYAMTGTVELAGSTLVVTARLVDSRNGGVVWGDRFVSKLADVHDTRREILARIVAALELQIPMNEAAAARSAPPESLDAWAAYHLGLQSMFRFNRRDNAIAGSLFQRAIAEDPGFARAHAGLSFVHFQNAFLRYTEDVPDQVRAARRFAERSVDLDPMDPFANLTMGRSFWLDGDLDAGLVWLERAVTISPNYAHGIYARAWTHALSGRGTVSRDDAETAMSLSPLDPLYYAMAATRALAHVALGEEGEAAMWAERAAKAPGAHVLIAVIAVAVHALTGDHVRAAAWAANAHERSPAITAAGFFRSFPFSDASLKQRIEKALTGFGI